MTKLRTNGVLRDMTAEEEEQHTKDKIAMQANADNEIAKQEKIASGKAKLKELGLDDDELKQILGI